MNVTTNSWSLRAHPILLAGLLAAGPWTGPATAADEPPAADRFVRLDSLAARYGLAYSEAGRAGALHFLRSALIPFRGSRYTGGAVTLSNAQHVLRFGPLNRRLMHNGHILWLNESTRVEDGALVLSAVDANTCIDVLMRPEALAGEAGYRMVVLDPGHGGRDRGAEAHGLQEKRLVLDIARRVRIHLVNAGLKVGMTRDNDRQVELEQRCRKAAALDADLFVSVHLNRAANTHAAGVETYVLPARGFPSTSSPAKGKRDTRVYPGNAFDRPSLLLAEYVHCGVLGQVGAGDRGVKRARFVVLREAPCPAVLVECGFLSNPDEAARLATDNYREDLALGLAKGILDFAGQLKRAELGP